MARKTISSSGSYWTGTSAKDRVYISLADSVSVNLGGGNDSLYDYLGYYATIDAGAGKDTIKLSYGNYSSVNAGDGNDKISLYGGGGTITVKGGTGNDTIYSSGYSVLHQYANGDGNDVIRNWSANDTLSITGGAWSSVTSGKNVIIRVGNGKITLKNAKGKKINIVGGGIHNTVSNTYVYGTGSADSITNSGSNVTISGGAGNDKIHNQYGNNSSIVAGDGNDSIYNRSFYTTISGGAGKNTIENYNGAWAFINTGDGNDSICNINAYDDDGHYVTISSGVGADTIHNQMGNYASINAGDGNDSIYDGSWFSTVLGGAGNDSIKIDGDSVTVDAGIGNDYVEINSKNVSIVGGKNNDTIVNKGTNNIYTYANGDGKDIIYNFGSTDTLQITGAKYTKKTSGNDVILTVGKGKITLKDAKGKVLNIDGTLKGGVSTLSIPSDAYTYNGHSYYIFSNKSTWEEAEAYCESRGGHLAVINNDAENSALYNYMRSKDYGAAYFGLSDAAEEGTWTWVNGEQVSYANWASGEPNGGIYENYGMFYYDYTNGEWNDGDFAEAEGTRTFICEWDTVTTGGGTSTVTVPPDTVSSGDATYGTSGNDNIKNSIAGALIFGYAGNDTIYSNGYNDVKIYGGDGADSIKSQYSDNVEISGGAGADKISVYSGNNASVLGDMGNDYIYVKGSGASIFGGDGADDIENYGSNGLIYGGSDNDYVYSSGSNVLVYGDAGNDRIYSYGSQNTVYGGSDNDSIHVSGNTNGFVDGGSGNDTIRAYYGDNVSLKGGYGNDFVSVYSGSYEISYSYGDGDDTVVGFNSDDTLKLTGSYTRSTVGNDVVFEIGSGSVILKNTKDISINITTGYANTAWFLEDDNNFSTNNELSALVEDKTYLPDIQLDTSTNSFKETQLITYTNKK